MVEEKSRGRSSGPSEAEVKDLHAKIGNENVRATGSSVHSNGDRERFFVRRAQEASPAKKRSMIQRDHPKLSISRQCKLVHLSRSAFYYAPTGVSSDTLAAPFCVVKSQSWAATACAG
ncbi:hypothetical protein [Celeribacter sp.]|uniref:hypothetical protein n=1 Tax=Celeribacter sp. TaxID=1890673 RepID=UPI003A9368B5